MKEIGGRGRGRRRREKEKGDGEGERKGGEGEGEREEEMLIFCLLFFLFLAPISGSPWTMKVMKKKKRFVFGWIGLLLLLFFRLCFVTHNNFNNNNNNHNSDKRVEELRQATDLSFSEWVLSIKHFQDDQQNLQVNISF